MRLRLDLALRAQPHLREQRAHRLSELGLGEHEKVLVSAAQHDERRDHARFRRQQQRRARLARGERFDVVRDHALQVVGRIRPRHPHVCTLPCSYVHGD